MKSDKNRDMPINFSTGQAIKSYVYALGFIVEDGFEVFYIGKTTNLKCRTSGHEHRETGAVAMYIGFDTVTEAYYAEKALICMYQPRKNIRVEPCYTDTGLANSLTNRLWTKCVNYTTNGKVKPAKYSELDDWDGEITEEMIKQGQEYLNDKVEIE